jgi:hypothetical protein
MKNLVDNQNLTVNKFITTPRQFIDFQVTLSSGKCQRNEYYFRCHVNQRLYYLTEFSVQHSFLAPKMRDGKVTSRKWCLPPLSLFSGFWKAELPSPHESCDELGGRFI